MHNHQNDQIWAANKQGIPLNNRLMFQRQKPASVMDWAGVASTGEKTSLFFIEEGVKVNQHMYLELLGDKLVPWVNTTFGESGITVQQDGATSHTASLVQEWCKRYMVGFLPKELRPLSSPDFNPMDFDI